jgi:muconate cycloisomerase
VSCPLLKPYDLSFTQLVSYESVWVAAEHENGAIGMGEAVALPGYNHETFDTVRTAVEALTAGADGESGEAIAQRCRDVMVDRPFAASAVMTALDMPAYLSHAGTGAWFPLSAPVSGDWPLAKLRSTVESYLSAGYVHIKCKVGRDFDCDVAAARSLLSDWPGRSFGVVFDANQAYAPDVAHAFARELHRLGSDRLQWFEQPVDRHDWDAMERLCRGRSAPIVLDESIYSEGDVERAAAMGAHGVKLKLMKNFGIVETLSLAHRARALGLTVVFGNGVATDLGNLGEYLVLAAGKGVFAAPSECSGFAKLRQPLLGSLLSLDRNGRFTCSGGAGEIADRLLAFSAQRVG